jgi:hypothetical protein
MKKSELRKLVLEMMGGYEPDGEGNLVPHNDKFDSTKLSSILLKVAQRRPEEEEDMEPISEEASNIQRLDISYTFPGQKFYSINVDGKKISNYEEANQIVNNLTGLDLPQRADYTDPEVYKIVDALKAKGIQAGSYEMDVS